MTSILRAMELRVGPLRPDIVVIYEAANNLSGDLRERAAERGLVRNSEFQRFSWPSQYSLLWNLVEKNLRVLDSERAARSDVSRLELDASTLGEQYRKELTLVVHEAQRHAKVVALATFAIQPRRDQTPEQQLRASSSAFVYAPFVTPKLIIDSYERYNKIAREVARDTGVLLIEGENDIPGDSLHFADAVHFTDLGSRAMARRVANALASSQQVRRLLAGATPLATRASAIKE